MNQEFQKSVLGNVYYENRGEYKDVKIEVQDEVNPQIQLDIPIELAGEIHYIKDVSIWILNPYKLRDIAEEMIKRTQELEEEEKS